MKNRYYLIIHQLINQDYELNILLIYQFYHYYLYIFKPFKIDKKDNYEKN